MFIINRVERVRMWARLRSIDSQLRQPSGDVPISNYRDLLEFTRCVSLELLGDRIILNRCRSVLYQAGIGRTAWELIIFALGTGHSLPIILVLSEWLDSASLALAVTSILRILSAVRAVSSLSTMSKSSLNPGHGLFRFRQFLQLGRVSSHYRCQFLGDVPMQVVEIL